MVVVVQVEVTLELFTAGGLDVATKTVALLRHRSQHLGAEHGGRDDPGALDVAALQQARAAITGHQVVRIGY